jgi:RimJ/RimL family protein N-acetyltransferase
MIIETARLRLTPHAPEHLLALIEGEDRFEECSGMRVAPSLRSFFVSEEVSPEWLAGLRESMAADPWRHGFAVVDRESGALIGSVGFTGPPDKEGTAEVAYGIAPDFQGCGYATEAAAAGVAFAFGSGLVRVLRAHTLPTANASMRVLEKCGFTRIGEIVDPTDGLVVRWERKQQATG